MSSVDVSSDLDLHGILGSCPPLPPQPPAPPAPAEWVRPAEWPDIDSDVGLTDDKFVALYAIPNGVDPTDGQIVAFRFTVASAGTYDVDWGDGTSDTGIASSAYVGHSYDPSNINLTATSLGYKIAKITVTASDNITNVFIKPAGTDVDTLFPGNNHSSSVWQRFAWLDICLRHPSFNQTWTWQSLVNVERVRIKAGTPLGTSFNNIFQNCWS